MQQQGEGEYCPYPDGHEITTECNTQVCPQNCEGYWTEWSDCSRPCGGGKRTRRFVIDKPAIGTGEKCILNGVVLEDGQVDEETCNANVCPIDCVGDWGPWTGCPTCKNEGESPKRSRTYTVSVQPKYGGKACPVENNNIETEDCAVSYCPIDCEENWTDWGACSSDRQGERFRQWNISRNPQYGGKVCTKTQGTQEREYCNMENPKVQGVVNHDRDFNTLTTTPIPGPPGQQGTLVIASEWRKYPATWGNKGAGVRVWINDSPRYNSIVSEKGQSKRRGDQVRLCAKSGDLIKHREDSSMTQDASVNWSWIPNDVSNCSNGEVNVGGSKI